ncbi:CRISPR-associated helicase Cas3' [uncultured Desulfobacter sp.]|uniref:CRISPR-associated helicase Cas3' n=1 Tax=uncultured Desulfobacter sp. TaxID=240139 RepID=UPI0029F5C1D5|nr:CRISPR-associated helicase Cas3' [uncultured Desulfobacter sp.]
MKSNFVAHHRTQDDEIQTVCEHLTGVASICKKLTAKIGLPEAGELLGLLHDIGKYSTDFQNYIKTETGLLNPDIDDANVDTKNLKGKIDHSTAGAQWVWKRFNSYGPQGKLVGQILAVCLASHHGGMIDCLRVEGENGFLKRIQKKDELTHLQTCLEAADFKIKESIEHIATQNFLKQILNQVAGIVSPKKLEPDRLKHFKLGFFTRFLFSCLIDADRIDSADFECPDNQKFRNKKKIDWQIAIDRLEEKLSEFNVRNRVDELRNKISNRCLETATKGQGQYLLTVPTGGGKTFASMRYALHHAQKHKLDHIIYVIPYTSIIDQNAREIRNVLEQIGDEYPWVLEHHSNLEPEKQTWQSKLSSENWDAPVIFTTMVQFLEALFGGGTRGPRRMHNLANSVIIFDEIQCLPINCIHLFCNGLNFLTDHARTTAVLCTATQPVLNSVNKEYGALDIPAGNELAGDTADLFKELKRVDIENKTRPGGWTKEQIAEIAVAQVQEKGNCLVIVNTKEWARQLYKRCEDLISQTDENIVFHLSTSLCPAHRTKILDAIRQRLDNELPLLCISTQLIEAGVDVDFNSVIRFLAGLDSIAQAAGRCNRNGNNDISQVYVVNPDNESIDLLTDIKTGRDKAERVLEEKGHEDFLSPISMDRYFSYYFYERADQMTYPLTAKQAGRQDTLLNLLSNNPLNVGRENDIQKATFSLQQSFKTAGKVFKSIDAPTQAIIVQYKEGKSIVADLCAAPEPAQAYSLLKKAQKYSVNLFPNVWDKLVKAQAVLPVQQGEEIYYLDEQYYSPKFGVSTEVVNEMETPII